MIKLSLTADSLRPIPTLNWKKSSILLNCDFIKLLFMVSVLSYPFL